MNKCVVWYNPNKDIYYHKIIKGHYEYHDYNVGSKNSYDHVIVHVIDNFDFKIKRIPIKKRIVRKTIQFLKKYD